MEIINKTKKSEKGKNIIVNIKSKKSLHSNSCPDNKRVISRTKKNLRNIYKNKNSKNNNDITKRIDYTHNIALLYKKWQNTSMIIKRKKVI
jgi:hypothetical protein